MLRWLLSDPSTERTEKTSSEIDSVGLLTRNT